MRSRDFCCGKHLAAWWHLRLVGDPDYFDAHEHEMRREDITRKDPMSVKTVERTCSKKVRSARLSNNDPKPVFDLTPLCAPSNVSSGEGVPPQAPTRCRTKGDRQNLSRGRGRNRGLVGDYVDVSANIFLKERFAGYANQTLRRGRLV